MKGPSSFAKLLCHVLMLALAASTAFAGEPQLRRQDDRVLTPRTETSPQLDNVRKPKTTVDVPKAADPIPRDIPEVDLGEAMRNQWLQCEQSAQELQEQFDALQVQNTSLQQQLQALQQKLNEATHAGGSAVTAYCESASVSRNTAGATTDCGPYKCEAVSGLCRTQCDSSSQCKDTTANTSYVCDTPYRQCIPAN